jgi:murein L,D-transpeptidase YafK
MPAPKKTRRGSAVLLLLLGGLFLSLGYAALWPGDFDRYLIRLKRLERATLAGFGLPLPGTPDLENLQGRLKAHGVALGVPVFMRIFKREFELELWLLRDGRYHHFATYPICRWSGELGPKLAQGDRQAPEGFYTVDEKALNPESRWHRSFNLGYPNAFDRAHGRTGSLLMVHGGCSSIGCFAMTDPVIDEIWRIVTAALRGGQPRFHVHVFPFRMTAANLARHARSARAAFWRDLRTGYDLFEAERLPPKTSVCDGRYVFQAAENVRDSERPIETRCPRPEPKA